MGFTEDLSGINNFPVMKNHYLISNHDPSENEYSAYLEGDVD